MRIVLDTNVFVSGIFFSGPPYTILKAWRDGTVELIISPSIFQEYRRVSDELSKQSSQIDFSEILSLLLTRSEMVESPDLPEPVCTDPDDDKFLACAVAASAPCVVSGDRHLLRVGTYRGVRVLTPRAFVDRYLDTRSDRHTE